MLAIEEYIKYYNKKRIKEKLGLLSPVEYRKLYGGIFSYNNK
ncbi:IS3 family transposase [Anaeromonas gelatinilytica]